MKLWIISLLSIILITLTWYYQSHPLVAKVKINDTIFFVEVAVTESQKLKGLGGRKSLGESRGMLFPYDHKEQYNFWMRDMLIPLDFIWIEGGVVADLTKRVPPPAVGERPLIITPKVAVDKVLEVNAGTIDRLAIKIGDQVQFLDR